MIEEVTQFHVLLTLSHVLLTLFVYIAHNDHCQRHYYSLSVHQFQSTLCINANGITEAQVYIV